MQGHRLRGLGRYPLLPQSRLRGCAASSAATGSIAEVRTALPQRSAGV